MIITENRIGDMRDTKRCMHCYLVTRNRTSDIPYCLIWSIVNFCNVCYKTLPSTPIKKWVHFKCIKHLNLCKGLFLMKIIFLLRANFRKKIQLGFFLMKVSPMCFRWDTHYNCINFDICILQSFMQWFILCPQNVSTSCIIISWLKPHDVTRQDCHFVDQSSVLFRIE